MASQWENFLKNLGNWRGSFAGVNLDGEITTEVPSILTLSLIDGNRDKVLFTLRRFENGGYDSEPTSNMSRNLPDWGGTRCFSIRGLSRKVPCVSRPSHRSSPNMDLSKAIAGCGWCKCMAMPLPSINWSLSENFVREAMPRNDHH